MQVPDVEGITKEQVWISFLIQWLNFDLQNTRQKGKVLNFLIFEISLLFLFLLSKIVLLVLFIVIQSFYHYWPQVCKTKEIHEIVEQTVCFNF